MNMSHITDRLAASFWIITIFLALIALSTLKLR